MKMLPFIRIGLLAPFAAALVSVVASGQIMLSPAAVVGTDLGTYSPEVALVNLINQSGVENPFVSGTTAFDTYFAVPGQTFATNAPANNWNSEVWSTPPLEGYVDFDLGASRRTTQLAIWNVTAKDVVVSFSEDEAGLGTAPGAGSFVLTNHASFSFSYPVDVLKLEAPQQGRYVRLAIKSAYPFVPGFTFTYAILGEVVASVLPPPPPAIAIAIARQPNGDVTVTFTGTLQTSSSLLDGSFADVPGNPQGTYTVPQASLSAPQYFRAQSR